jgi:arylsulfatase A-like enzyme
VDEYLTDAFAREGVDFIDRHKDRPFLLLLSFNAVHTPIQATSDRIRKFAAIGDENRRVYAAMATALDEAVGRVLDKLREERLEEDTMIVFLSDNGGPTMPGSMVNGSRNTPLRGSKATMLEGGIRVPFCVQWKGHLPSGLVYHEPVIHLDLLPTALAAAGIEERPEWGIDGVNLLPHWTGRATGPPHEMLYWRLHEQMAIRRGDWKLVSYDAAIDGTTVSGGEGPEGTVTPRRLYNLAEDIHETNDLSARHPEKVRELEDRWQAWRSGCR